MNIQDRVLRKSARASRLFGLSLVALTLFLQSYLFADTLDKVSYSLFAEGGETESVFIIDGRNFPVRIGSIGLKATLSPDSVTNLYGKAGFGYSQKQSVSAYDYNLSGSVFSTSFGGGATRKFPVSNSNFVFVPFIDINIFNYSSDTFRGDRNGEKLKATIKGNSTFVRGGLEMQYLTQNGHFFFGGGLNNWDIANEVSVKTGNMIITPRVWADNLDSFFQIGVAFDTGSSDAVVGMRLSDLTFDINTQLVEVFAEVQIAFGGKESH